MKRKVLFVAVFAALYTITTPIVGVMALGAAMSGFEPGHRVAAPATIWFFGALSDLLMLPLMPFLAPHGAPAYWGYAIIFANGAIWGTALVALWNIVRRWRAAIRAASASAA
jgi:hypothetical protein